MNVKGALRRAGAKVENSTKHRVYSYGTSGAGNTLAAATTSYISLLTANNAPDDEIITDGTTIAQCEEGSRITKIELMFIMKADQAKMHEIMLFRDDDGLLATLVPSNVLARTGRTSFNLHGSKSILGYMPYYLTSNADARPRAIKVSQAALARNRNMNEDDILKLAVTNNGAAQALWWLFGAIYTVN